MKYSQKYCLVQPLQPLELGYTFHRSEWPLHCTLAGVFAIDWNEATYRDFEKTIGNYKKFIARTTLSDYFGEDGSVKVRRVDESPALTHLHNDIVDAIERHDGVFNQPTYIREDFGAHVTMVGDLPREHDTVNFNEIYLIDMFPEGDYEMRRVIKKFPLASR